MTNTGGLPAGWYHAEGDPEGTQRYWDGSQWIGEPQTNQGAGASHAPTPPPSYSPPAGGDAPPAYGAPTGGEVPPAYGAPAGGTTPPGYQAYGSANALGAPADWVKRFVAYLIDIAPVIGLYVLIAIAGAISDALGLIVGLVGYIAVIGYSIWNFYIVQGKTGQTIGKKQQGIKLIKDDTGQPVGGLMAFVRYLVSGAFYLLCCIGGIVNLLAPLWNKDKKTYSDQILSMSVVEV